ncbi:MAG: alpha/beta fold hydrolase [Pseudomonadota bacterium]
MDFGPGDGWPLLVVPSLVNRAYIMDLMPGASLLEYLRDNGIRPMLLDWGEGQNAESLLSIDGLITDHIEPALDWVRSSTGKRPLVAGYCMGGTLALALACRSQDRMAGLALLAAPWDFGQEAAAGRVAARHHKLTSLTGHAGSAPVDFLQVLFAHIDPLSVPRKFARFAQIDATSETALRFVAIEDWLNDGVALNADIFNQCLIDWFIGNAPARGGWRLDGLPIKPERLMLPVFLAIPDYDRIVPPASALPLVDLIPHCEWIRPKAGHVGMVAGLNAETSLWLPLMRWLRRIAALQKKPW